MSFWRGSIVWVEDKENAWVEGEVLDVKNGTAVVNTAQGKRVTSPLGKLLPRDPEADHGGVDDMTKLIYLNEPGVLYNLSRRYALNEIYTYTGSILIAINPFTKLPHLYNEHMMEQYKGVQFGELSPHAFAIADAAYRAMMNQARSQSILVSGESGAGKTETTKLIMQYLTYVGGRTSGDDRSVEQQVLESNPLLEAFGNAKTVRNDNSSRFGKFVEIQFDGSGRICGAAIRTYLLERSRVVKITDPERNYHCFYQLCASVKEAEMYKLGHASNFHYLNQSNTYELDGRDNSHEFSKTRRAMDIVGISHYDQEAIFRILAAILHLGNVEFAPKKEHDSSEVKDERSNFHLKMAANLFMCDEKVLLSTLCFRYLKTHDGNIAKALDCSAAVASRDTLAKTVYARLFDWLVEKINKSIGQIECSRLMIGLLDIYGFECFKINSFEQFCINFANEKLQQHFNQHIFKMEQEEYTNEQINWSYIDFVDNQDILDLIEKKPVGIVSLLDEACMFPKATHDTFAMKLFQSFPTHPRLEKAKFSKSDFSLSHYAGKVLYQTSFFLDKNRDYVVAEHWSLLSSSRCSFISRLFASVPEEPSRSSYKFSSVASRFKQQLQALMETLNSTEPHYVRCIKPNSSHCPRKFENRSVLHQLRCGGVLEAVRISLAGYPTRRTYSEFVDRFGILASEHKDQRLDEKTLTERILRKLQFKNFQLGKSKVFLRAGQIAILDARRNEILDKAAKLIQCYYRRFFAHRVFHSQRMAAITIQAFYQGYLSRSLFKLKKTNWAATLIQKYIRRWLSRHAFLHLHSATLLIQSSIRIFSKHIELLHWKEQSAAIFIQAHWKMLKACSTFKLYRCSAIFLQCSWRRKVATRELRRLKMAANETGALRKAKNILETKLEDLTLRLTLEKRLRVASEESKAMEVSKLQNALETLSGNLDATKVAYLNEQAKNKTVQEQLGLVLKENSSLYDKLAKMEELQKENWFLKCSLESLTKKNLEMEQELMSTRKCSHATADLLQEVEAKCFLLQQNLKDLEEKLVILEDENQILRQKALNLSPRKSLSGALKPIPENHSFASLSSTSNQRFTLETSISPKLPNFLPRSLSDLRKSRMIIERCEEYQDLLQKCIKEDLGFRDGKPVAACIIYKCLLNWHAFEAEKTDIFDYVIDALNVAVKADNENDILPYWLTNASALLCLLQRNLRSNGFLIKRYRHSTGSLDFSESILHDSNFAQQLMQMDQGSSFVDARYPAMLFKQQLTACLEKIFGLIRDNLKKEISPLLSLCIQAPKSTRGSSGRTLKSPGGTVTQQPLSNHWDRIIKFLDSLMNRLQKNYVPSFFIRKLVTQVFSFINIQLFNSLLLRRECCTFTNGEYVKSGLSVLEKWITDATEEFAGSSWNELNYIRQSVEFLVLPQKRRMSLDEITQDLCSALSVRQIYRICTMYWDDKYSTHSVSTEVVATMRDMVNGDSQIPTSNSFLLDDDLSIPFTTEDISKSIEVIDPFNVQLPSSLHKYPAAHFLLNSEQPSA